MAHARTPWNGLNQEEIDSWRRDGVYYRLNGRTQQQMPINYSLYEEYKAHKSFLDLETTARQITIPWLIVHGENDEAVFVKDAYILKECQAEASVYIIENTGHTFGRKTPSPRGQTPLRNT